MTTFYTSSFDRTAIGFDLSPLEEALQENQFERIAGNTHLFWLAFCKMVVNPNSSHYFPSPLRKDEDNIVNFVGPQWALKSFQDKAEDFRIIFHKSYESNVPLEIPAELLKNGMNHELLLELAPMLDRSLEQISESFVLKPKSSVFS